jgi:lysyl-tRNA synthetase class I
MHYSRGSVDNLPRKQSSNVSKRSFNLIKNIHFLPQQEQDNIQEIVIKRDASEPNQFHTSQSQRKIKKAFNLIDSHQDLSQKMK